jgi:DNA polymerase elongation subunit (family B)
MIRAEKDLEKAKASGEPIQDLINDISKYKNLQMAKKIALNSAYGALANIYFRFYNKQIAESITVSGQLAIRWIARKLNEYLNKILKTDNKDYVIAIDTDSVVGDTKIYVNGNQISIEEYYNSITKDNIIKEDSLNESFVKEVNDDTSYGLDQFGSLREKRIKYVMKHKVRKKLYKITISDKSVIVTEDHSVIVKRDGKYISIKPSMIDMDTDTLIFINNN